MAYVCCYYLLQIRSFVWWSLRSVAHSDMLTIVVSTTAWRKRNCATDCTQKPFSWGSYCRKKMSLRIHTNSITQRGLHAWNITLQDETLLGGKNLTSIRVPLLAWYTLMQWLLVSAINKAPVSVCTHSPPGSFNSIVLSSGPSELPGFPLPSRVLHSLVSGSTVLIWKEHTLFVRVRIESAQWHCIYISIKRSLISEKNLSDIYKSYCNKLVFEDIYLEE